MKKQPCLSFIDNFCGPVPSPDNGAVILYTGSFYGSEAGVVCNTGHTASDTTITCMEHGLWINATCEPVGKKSYSVMKLFITFQGLSSNRDITGVANTPQI